MGLQAIWATDVAPLLTRAGECRRHRFSCLIESRARNRCPGIRRRKHPEELAAAAAFGRRIGVRYHDLRSRGTSQNNDGVTVTLPRDQSQEKR
jgi:hypothetical protein